MVSERELDKSRELSSEVLEVLSQKGLAPTPENYELFYKYCAGTDTKIKLAIDAVQRQGKQITEQDCTSFHRDFIEDTKSLEVMKRSEESILSIMNEVTHIVQEVNSAAGSYDESLEQSSQNLSNISSIDELKSVVTTIVSSTKEMRAQNSKLEKELDSSSKQMATLHKEMETVRKEAKTDGLTI